MTERQDMTGGWYRIATDGTGSVTWEAHTTKGNGEPMDTTGTASNVNDAEIMARSFVSYWFDKPPTVAGSTRGYIKGGYGETYNQYPVMVNGRIKNLIRRSCSLGPYVYVNRQYWLIKPDATGSHYELARQIPKP